MKVLSTKYIGEVLGAEVIGDAMVKGLNVDTSFVKEGDIFVCLVGERVDGHTFAQQAIDKGAKALIVNRKLDVDVSQIIVEDTLQALFDFAKYYRNQMDMEVIAITGSNGKTSTKDILSSTLSLVDNTVATYENQNTVIGSCLTLFRCDEHTRYGIFEMGLDAPGELVEMTKVISPTAAIITNLDQAHMDNFEDDYAVLGKEKFSIFNAIEDKSRCFYQGDFEVYRNLATNEKSFGFNSDNDYIISDVQLKNDLTEFKLEGQAFATNLLGEHQASNAAGVILLLKKIGIRDEVIAKGLKSVNLTSMRTEIYPYRNATILFDAYKSSPQSLLAILDLLGSYDTNLNKVAVLADMYQLGKGTEAHHEEALERALEKDISAIYLMGEEFEKAKAKFNDERIKFYKDKAQLKEALQSVFNEENFIMFKGSRYYQLEDLMKED